MPGPRRATPPVAAAALLAALLAAASLAACGMGSTGSGARSRPRTHAVVAVEPPQTSCAATVVEDLARIALRVYREGVASERTLVATRLIAASAPLRQAVAAGSAEATSAAARTLVASGHMTNLRVLRGASVLADVGGAALAPIRGRLAGGASYVASVWSTEGFLAETEGVTEGKVALRAHGRSVAGSFALPAGPLPDEGTVAVAGVRYRYASFPAEAFPAGRLRVYVLRSAASVRPLCHRTREATTLATMARIARLIYDAEGGRRTEPQVQRVQADPALLAAVAARDPTATRVAVERLLNQHIVRLRVFAAPAGAHAAPRLLADVGGPFVLAPVTGALTAAGRTIGSFVLSIQDDEGYLRLTRRLVGLRVLMYMGSGAHLKLVKNSLGPEPGPVPGAGRYAYRGATFNVYTLHARAFPSGPLTIRVLVPIPYR